MCRSRGADLKLGVPAGQRIEEFVRTFFVYAHHFSFLTFVGLPERLSRAAGRKHGGDSRAKSARGFSKFDLLFFLHIKF